MNTLKCPALFDRDVYLPCLVMFTSHTLEMFLTNSTRGVYCKLVAVKIMFSKWMLIYILHTVKNEKSFDDRNMETKFYYQKIVVWFWC